MLKNIINNIISYKMSYAFVTLLYPNKNNEYTYLDGALLMALGLRKQNVKNKIICMITPDVNMETRTILKILYDEIVEVQYISPINKSNHIKIISEIFSKKHYIDDNNYSDICNVFTKLHIFDSDKFNYDKIVFIDTDIIPIKGYDKLFELNTPAGWVEQIKELNEGIGNYYTRIWGVWENIKHNQLIPKFITDIYKIPGSCINAGLIVITPDKYLFNFFIKELQTPKNIWFDCFTNNPNIIHKGAIDTNKKHVDFYPFPEQCYLTQHFSGKWHMIDGLYASWREIKNKSKGIHMAGLKYEINGVFKEYKTWILQIPINDGFNEITNNIAIWGLITYPELRKFLMKDLKILIKGKIFRLDELILDKQNYEILLSHQKELIKILCNI